MNNARTYQTHEKYAKFVAQLRSGFRTAATSKLECFEIIVNGWKPLTIITKCSILDVTAALDPPLQLAGKCHNLYNRKKRKIRAW